MFFLLYLLIQIYDYFYIKFILFDIVVLDEEGTIEHYHMTSMTVMTMAMTAKTEATLLTITTTIIVPCLTLGSSETKIVEVLVF